MTLIWNNNHQKGPDSCAGQTTCSERQSSAKTRHSTSGPARFMWLQAALLILLFALPTQAQRSVRVIGCCLSGSAVSLTDIGIPLVGNFNTRWEAALLEDSEILNSLFGVHPHLFYIRERNGMNAFTDPHAYPELLAKEGTTPEECPDGTIFIGVSLIKAEYDETHGSLQSLPAVLAHEYGHVMQNHYRCPFQGKWRELHADFMAGYFIGHRERYRSQSVAEAMTTIYNKGDYNFNEPGHHGTPAQRREAFLAGYLLNKLSQVPSGVVAYKTGMNFLRSKGATP